MLCFYSCKGGSGCSVTAAAVALVLARFGATLLVDLAGDLPDILGLPPDRSDDPGRPGLARWLADDRPGPDEIPRLEVPVTEGLSMLASGGHEAPGSANLLLLAAVLAAEPRSVVVDVGSHRAFDGFLAQASRSVLVTRACYVALSRARQRPSPDDIVLVHEPHRALTASDVAAVLGAPVTAQVDYEPRVFRAVDAGLLAERLPRSLRRLEVFR